jgi:hypothetical protein
MAHQVLRDSLVLKELEVYPVRLGALVQLDHKALVVRPAVQDLLALVVPLVRKVRKIIA